MPHGSESPEGTRAGRVRLVGTVLALVQLKNGQHIRAKVHQLSVHGGILNMPEPLDEALRVELLFQVGSSTVRNQAEMLDPIWATRGCLQPFRFINLSEEERRQLNHDLAGLMSSGSNRRNN